MKKEFKVFRCNKCGAMVINFQECNTNECKIECCDGVMEQLVSNSAEASFEKHIPTYNLQEGVIKAKVNHVMQEEHYIEWIAYVTENAQELRYFEPNMIAEAEFKYYPNSKLYSFCNKHGLWENVVE